MLVIPAAFFFAKPSANKIIIKINIKGIYNYRELITDWGHYIDSTLSQKEMVECIEYDFILTITYNDSDRTCVYTKEIPLINTQDRSEEEILDAIQFYYEKAHSKAR